MVAQRVARLPSARATLSANRGACNSEACTQVRAPLGFARWPAARTRLLGRSPARLSPSPPSTTASASAGTSSASSSPTCSATCPANPRRIWSRSPSATATGPSPPHDLGLRSADACANVWAFLTNRLNETVVQFYTPRPRPTRRAQPASRLLGPAPRPGRRAASAEDDCAIAVVLGPEHLGARRQPAGRRHASSSKPCATRSSKRSPTGSSSPRSTAGPQDRRN